MASQTDRLTDRPTDRQTDRPTDRQTVVGYEAIYVLFHTNFAASIVCRRYQPCEFPGFVWTDCWGNKSYYVITSPANRVYHALLYSRQTCEILRARDCDLFPMIYLISLSENYSKIIEGKLAGFLSVKDVDLIQSNLKSVSIFSYY